MKSPIIIFGILLTPAISHALIDTNTNGVSDLWERAHNNGQLFPQTYDPQADPDEDGWSNAQEAAAGTDPNNANPPDGILCPDVAHIPAVMGTDGNGQPMVITPESVVISWTTLPGKQYTLLRSFDLAGSSWQPFDAPFIGNGNLVEYGYPTADADRLFVRVAVSDVDSEEDGLTDAEEVELNTDPELEDSDFDGLTDAEEISLDIDPNDSDSDDDGVSDGNEIAQETDPNDSDTDNDLILDGKDADPKEILVDWEMTSEAVYALIDVDGPPGEIARDLNDMGEVLFTTGLWSGGNYALIPPPAPLSGSFPSGGETQTYDVDLTGYQSFNSDLKVTGWSHVRYTSGQSAGGDGTDTAWAQSLGQSAEHLADAVPFNFTNVLSMQPMGVDNSGRTFSRNSYAFYSPPEVMHEGRRIVVSGLPGNDPPVFLQPANGYYVDGQTWQGYADVSRSGALVTNTASAIDNTPNKSYQLAMWDSSLGEVALPTGTNTWFYPIHLNDLPNGKPALAATTTGAGGDGVYLKNPVTGHMEKCESLSGKHIQIFAGDGSAITGDHQLWRNGKLTPMRNLCERYGNLLDAGWDFRPLESNKHGAFLLVATGPNGEQENKLAVKVEIRGFTVRDVEDNVGVQDSKYVKEKYRQLIVDSGDPTGFRTEARKELKISQWDDVFEYNSSAEKWQFSDTKFVINIDVFRIRLPKGTPPPDQGKHRFKIWTETAEGGVVDAGAIVELDPVQDFYQSGALCLVADDTDDAHAVDGKADGALNDHTYKADLGGMVNFEWLTPPGGGPNPVGSMPVPVKKVVAAHGYILQEGGTFPAPAILEANANALFEHARKVLSTCGVKLDYLVSTISPNPAGVDFGSFALSGNTKFENPTWVTDHVEFPLSEAKDVMNDARLKPGTGVVPVYFAGYFRDGLAGATTVESAMLPADIAYANAVFLDSPTLSNSTLAHELMHVLLNAVHEGPNTLWGYNNSQTDWCIWYTNNLGHPETGIGARKRIVDTMRSRMLKSKFSKNPNP